MGREREQKIIYNFIEQEFDNIIEEFFGICKYNLRISNEEKKKFIKNKIKNFLIDK